MKILFLCRLYSPHIGGVEKHVAEISRMLRADGHKITIITERYDEKLKDYEVENGIHIYRISTGHQNKLKKIIIWKEIFKIRRLIADADIIHCHDVFFWYLPFRSMFLSKPVYTTFHGYESYPIKKKAILIRKLSEKLSWGNICIGDFITKWYGTKPGYISYGAVTVQNVKTQKLASKKDSAVFIGRLDEQTGILTYTKAVEIVQKKRPGFTLSVVGDGKYKSKIDKKFSVLGFQKEPEKYYPKYHFAFVSRYLSILEAFAARKLVFAVYDNPVKEDYLRMAPFAKWIVIEKDPQTLVEKIEYYLDHPAEEKELIEHSFEWVKDQTWEKLIGQYKELWRITV